MYLSLTFMYKQKTFVSFKYKAKQLTLADIPR